jgi:hypothetical protein
MLDDRIMISCQESNSHCKTVMVNASSNNSVGLLKDIIFPGNGEGICFSCTGTYEMRLHHHQRQDDSWQGGITI